MAEPHPPTPLGDYFRAQADRQRELAAARPADTRHLQAAAALEDLAANADRQVEQGGFYATHLERHHVDDQGRFAWADGHAGRAVGNYGYDRPPDGPGAHEDFLGELCNLVNLDVAAHISAHEAELDRRDAPALARRYGVGLDRVHNALDRVRYPTLFQVGVPHWHALTPAIRRELEELDGVWVEQADPNPTDPERPTHVNNVGAHGDAQAREIVGRIARIDPAALGARAYPRIFRAQ